MTHRQTQLRPSQGGRFRQPVAPSSDVVAAMRAHDDRADFGTRQAVTLHFGFETARKVYGRSYQYDPTKTMCRCCGVQQPNDTWVEHEAKCSAQKLDAWCRTLPGYAFGTGLIVNSRDHLRRLLAEWFYAGHQLPSGEMIVEYERSIEAGRTVHAFRLDSFQPNGSRTIVLPEPEV